MDTIILAIDRIAKVGLALALCGIAALSVRSAIISAERLHEAEQRVWELELRLASLEADGGR